MKTLFIGGQEDGKWWDVDPNIEWFVVPEKQSESVCDFDKEATGPSTYNELRYTEQKLATPTNQYRVMVLLEDHECLMDRLIKGYTAKQSEDT